MRIKTVSTPRSKTIIRLLSKEKSKKIDDFEGLAGEIAVRYHKELTYIFAGIGPGKEITGATMRSSACNAVQKARQLKRKSICLELSGLPRFHFEACEGACLGTYTWDKYLTKKTPTSLSTIEVLSKKVTPAELRRVNHTITGVFFCRDLVNDNAEVVTPAHLAALARKLGKDRRLQVKIITGNDIDKEKLGLLKAVGKGSQYPPHLIIMRYTGDPASNKNHAIVGKGITFDSGGQNLKPNGSIETMRCDMAGAATVLGIMKTVTELKPKINIIGVCAAAHNAIGSKAYFPGDVYTSYKGKTVEICNTDAEGRLVLADALAYTIQNYRPSEIIDLATLTGGILSAFSTFLAGLFSNNRSLAKSLFSAGETTNERLWELPVYEDFSETMKGDRSDLRNTTKLKRGHASSITAAAFLKEFIDDIPWAHLDIAGTAYNDGEEKAERPKFGTGFGVRLLLHYLLSQESK